MTTKTPTSSRPATQGLSAADSAQYRLLEVGERLEAGDEFLSMGEWSPVWGAAIGWEIQEASLGIFPWGYYRRPVASKAAAIPSIVIVVEGGVIQSILADAVVLALVVDYDTEGGDPQKFTPIPDGAVFTDAYASVCVVEVDPARVNKVFAAVAAHEAKPRGSATMNPYDFVRFALAVSVSHSAAYEMIAPEARPSFKKIADAAEDMASALDPNDESPVNLRKHASRIGVADWARGKGAL